MFALNIQVRLALLRIEHFSNWVFLTKHNDILQRLWFSRFNKSINSFKNWKNKDMAALTHFRTLWWCFVSFIDLVSTQKSILVFVTFIKSSRVCYRELLFWFSNTIQWSNTIQYNTIQYNTMKSLAAILSLIIVGPLGWKRKNFFFPTGFQFCHST